MWSMEAPECPVCLQAYNEDEVIPRVLSCGHTLCQPCIQQLPPSLPNTIKCPECNQLAKYPAQGPSGLPRNIDLLRLIAPLNSAEISKTPNKRHSPPSASNPSNELFAGFPTEGKDKIWREWTIPGDSIHILEDRGDSVSLGTATASWSGLRKNEKVGLLPLFVVVGGDGVGVSDSVISLSYGLRALKMVNCLSDVQRNELLQLFKVSRMSRRICRSYGLWLSSDDRLFLVSEGFCCDGSRYWDELRSGWLEKSCGGLVGSKDVMIEIACLALELCEAVMELHSQGIILGFVNPICFCFDEYGHVLIDLSNTLVEKRRVVGIFSDCKNKGSGFDDLVKSLTFLSPEVFRVLYDEPTLNFVDLNAGTVSQSPIGFQSDVWALACILMTLLLGDSFIQEFLSDCYCYWATASRGGTDINPKGCKMNTIHDKMRSNFSAQFEELQHLLSRCFDHDMSIRPHLSDLWKCIKGNFISHASFLDDVTIRFQQQNVESCFVLGQLYASPKHIDSTSDRTGRRLEKNNPGVSDVLAGPNLDELVVTNDQTSTRAYCLQVPNKMPEDGAKTITLKGHLDCISGLTIHGGYLLSSSFDKTVGVWSLKDFCHVRSFRCHEHRVMAVVVVDLTEPLCISGDSGGGIYVWPIDHHTLGEQPLQYWREHSDWRYSGVHSLAVSGVEILYSGSGDKSIKAWTLKDYSLICTMTGHRSVICTLSVNNGILYSGSWDGSIRLWWTSDHSPVMVLEEPLPTSVSSVLSLSVDHDIVVTAHENGTLKMWRNAVLVKSTKIDGGPILSIYMKGKWLFATTWNKKIIIQELCEEESELQIRHAGSIDCDSVATSLLYSEGKLFVGFSNKCIKVFYLVSRSPEPWRFSEVQ